MPYTQRTPERFSSMGKGQHFEINATERKYHSPLDKTRNQAIDSLVYFVNNFVLITYFINISLGRSLSRQGKHVHRVHVCLPLMSKFNQKILRSHQTQISKLMCLMMTMTSYVAVIRLKY